MWTFMKGKVPHVCHMGVLTSTNPLLVTHRDGALGQPIPDEPIKDVPTHFRQRGYSFQAGETLPKLTLLFFLPTFDR